MRLVAQRWLLTDGGGTSLSHVTLHAGARERGDAVDKFWSSAQDPDAGSPFLRPENSYSWVSVPELLRAELVPGARIDADRWELLCLPAAAPRIM